MWVCLARLSQQLVCLPQPLLPRSLLQGYGGKNCAFLSILKVPDRQGYPVLLILVVVPLPDSLIDGSDLTGHRQRCAQPYHKLGDGFRSYRTINGLLV